MGWRRHVKPNYIVKLLGKLGVIRQLELPVATRLQTVRLPDAAHRAGADPAGVRHHIRRPVRRLARGIGEGQRHHTFGHLGREAGNARRPGFVSQQAIDTFGREALLPALHTGLRLARLPHDRSRADPIGGQQNDRSAPSMLLGGIAIPHHSPKAEAGRLRIKMQDGSGTCLA